MSTDLCTLAWELASEGFAGREDAVGDVVRTARARALPSVVTGVLADRGQPEVARLRAFGRIATLLSAGAPPGRVTRAA